MTSKRTGRKRKRDEDEEEEAKIAPTPRKRGRPRKERKESETPAPKAKGKRGRPRKKPAEDAEESKESPSEKNQTKKRKQEVKEPPPKEKKKPSKIIEEWKWEGWKEIYLVGTEWENYDSVFNVPWNFDHLYESLDEGELYELGKKHPIYLFGCTERKYSHNLYFIDQHQQLN